MPLIDISSLRHHIVSPSSIDPLSVEDEQNTPVNPTEEIKPIDTTAVLTAASRKNYSFSGMNSNLLAEISAANIGKVFALVLDSNLSQESTWSTPFENSNSENRAPSLLGSLQSGVASETASAFGLENLSAGLEKVSGRSSFTKVNSTQIYVSSQSAQIQMTLLFSAWSNPQAEVEIPLGLLHQMSVPVELSDKTLVQNVASGEQMSIETFFPSIIPPKITLKYGGRTYKDLILQSFSRPLSGNMDKHGNLMQAEVQITLVGYQAWDGKDIASMYGRKA